jgi:aspartate kinase
VALVVQKFGGSSVSTPERILEAARKAVRCKKEGNDVIVVVSAMGRTTDDLIALSQKITTSPSAREMDSLLATGEQISVALTAMALQELGEKSVGFTGPQIGIVTDSVHRKARIKSIETKRLVEALSSGHIVVVAGFQGMDEQYDITTLGRGGSDTTAVAVAAALKQSGYDVRCDIYTDVDGIYTTDPRIVPEARKIDAISYDEMLEMASLGAGVMHSRSIEFAKKFDVPLMVRNSFSDAIGSWIVPEAEWMTDFAVSGAALATDEARIVLDNLPDVPGVSHRIFSALAEANITVDMIGQNVGNNGRATIGFTVISSELTRTKKTLEPIMADLGASLREGGRVSKVSVVGAGMRAISGVAETMFNALADAGISMTMITTGDIKISALIEETMPEAVDNSTVASSGKQSHEEAKKAVLGRKALRALHAAFKLDQPRKGAGVPTSNQGSGVFKVRSKPHVSATERDRESAVAKLDGMEDILVSGVHLSPDQARITIFDLPDRAGNCTKVFNAVASGGILVDMIVQNITSPGRAELSFTIPATDLKKALERTQEACQSINKSCKVAGDSNIAVVYVLGVGMRTHTGVGRMMFGALASKGINISMINTSEVCIGVVIDKSRGTEAVACLKEKFLV